MDQNHSAKIANLKTCDETDENNSNGPTGCPKRKTNSSWSPTEEVEELTNLNTKLSRYIDRVRSLHGENRKLTSYAASIEESRMKESEQIHVLYREKIQALKDEKEKLSRKVANLGTSYENIRKENDKLKDNIACVDKELKARNEKQLVLEKEMNTLRKNSSNFSKVKNKLEIVYCKMKQDEISFSEQLKEFSVKIERMSLECQNLHERLKVNSVLLNQKLVEQKETIEKSYQEEDSNDQIKSIVVSFQERILEEKNNERANSGLISKLLTEISENIEFINLQEYKIENNKSKLKNLNMKVKYLLEEQDAIKEKLRLLKTQQVSNSMNQKQEVQEKEGEIEVIMEKIRKQAEDMENLVLEKQGLDAEIAVFKKLVETEEERLGVTKDDGRKYKKSPHFTFVEEKEKTARREIVLSERQL